MIEVPVIFVAVAALVGVTGGIAVGLFFAGVIEWTRKPEDDLARRDRMAARR